MIHGHFVDRANGSRAAAHLLAAIQTAPGLNFLGVDFLMDTGADFTVIHPADAARLWNDYLTHDFAHDPDMVAMGGIGGTAAFVKRTVRMQLTDDALGILEGPCEVWIAAPSENGLYGLPSLLGRDVIRQFVLTVGVAGITLEQSAE